jgi:hypothetical protein
MGRAALLCFAALLLVVGAAVEACGGSSEDVVARVGKTAITKPELDHWERIRLSAPGDRALRSAKLRALGFLIWSAQTVGQAEELGVTVDDGRAKRLLEDLEASWKLHYKGGLVPREAELQSQLQAAGETTADRRRLMKLHLLAADVERAQSEQAEHGISRAQLLAYYRGHRGHFILPERRNITAIITWRKSTAANAKRALEAGESPKSVVERFNEQPSEGGLRVGLTRGNGKKRYERDFFAARPHVLVGPVKELMYFVFEVTKIVPARMRSLTEVQAAVRRELIRGELRDLSTAVMEASLRRWRLRTRCAPGYVVERCTGVGL